MSVVQSRGRGKTGLGEVQGSARSISGLCATTGVVDQSSAAGSELGSQVRGCTTHKGAHSRGSTLVLTVVGLSGGTGRAGLSGNGSHGNGRAQGKGHTRTTAGTGGSVDGGAGLWNAVRGGGWRSGQRASSGGNVNGNEVALPFL